MSDDNQVEIRRFWFGEQLLEQHLDLSLPNAWLSTIENPIDHAARVIGVESSHTIETGVTDDLRPGANDASHLDSRSVVVSRTYETQGIVRVLSDTPSPDTAKSQDCHAHNRSRTFQPFVFLPLRVQLLLETINVSHKVRVRTLDVDGLPVAPITIELL